MPTQKNIEHTVERTRSAKPSAWVTGYAPDRYVDERHINVTTTIGDLAGSHSAAYEALKKAGITPSRLSAGSFRLTVDENLPLSRAKALVVAALKAAGIKVYDEPLADISPSGTPKRLHAIKKRVLEKGQRVAVLDYLGHEIGRGHVYSSDNYPAPNEYTTWVKMTRQGETTTEEWPTDRVRSISKYG